MARFLPEQQLGGAVQGGLQSGFTPGFDVIGGPRAARVTGDELPGPRARLPETPGFGMGGFTPLSPFFQLGALGGMGPVTAPSAPGFDPMEALVQQLEQARKQFLQAVYQMYMSGGR